MCFLLFFKWINLCPVIVITAVIVIATTPMSGNKPAQYPQHSCSFCSLFFSAVEACRCDCLRLEGLFYCRKRRCRYVCLCTWICRIYCMCVLYSSWVNKLIIILLRSPPSSSFHIHAHIPPNHYVASLSQVKLRSRPRWLNTNNKYAGGGRDKDELSAES